MVPADVRDHIAQHHLTERSSWRASGRTAVIVALYAGLAWTGFRLQSWAAWVAIWLVQSCILVGSYSAMHEAAHATLYRSRRANRVAGAVWALTILTNWSMWRSFHLEHHAHTGIEGDPKLKYRFTVTRRVQYLLLPIGGLAFMGELWVASLGTLFGRFPAYVRTSGPRTAIRLDAALLLGTTVAAVAGTVVAPAVVIPLWIAPLVFTSATLTATGMSEHYGCALGGEVFETTRSVVSNRAFRFLVWNNNFHAGHHLAPAVPFHHAPALHRFIEPRVQHLSRSYARFHADVLRSCGRDRVLD